MLPRLLFFLYDLLFLVAACIWLPLDYVRCRMRGLPREGLWERIGLISAARLRPLDGKKVYWIHAVSVGETRASLPLISHIKKQEPDAAILVTNVTETGHRTALAAGGIDLCLFCPLDFSLVVRRMFRRIRPAVLLIVETEIWPNMIRLARRQQIPVLLVNGRISDRSYPRYRYFRFILQPVLSLVQSFCMQSTLDAERIAALGAPRERILTTGNVKFDQTRTMAAVPSEREARQQFRLPATIPVWVAGSTHDGEEELLMRVFRRLMLAEQPVVMILAPRHPARCAAVMELLRKYGFPYQLRSEQSADSPALASGSVLLLDTLGELVASYAAANVVFVGGSLLPVGGHNILEAAMVSRPAVWGPHMQNFKEIDRLMKDHGGGLQVATVDELYDVVRMLLTSPAEAQKLGQRGAALLREHAGATARTWEQIVRCLQESGNGQA